MDCDEVDHWFDYFQSNRLDVFKLMEAAIEVAHCYQPDNFSRQRERMAGLIYSKPDFKLSCGMNKEIILRSMGKEPAKGAEATFSSVRGIAENKIKSRCIIKIKSKRKKVEQEPKYDDEHKLRALKDALKEPGKTSGDPEPKQYDFEASKRKLEERYKEIKNARKKIRMIDLKDIPACKSVDCRSYNRRRTGAFGVKKMVS